MAADLSVVPTITFRLLDVLVIVAHERRALNHLAVTEHPTAPWDLPKPPPAAVTDAPERPRGLF